MHWAAFVADASVTFLSKPNPGVGAAVSSLALHSSGWLLKVPQIVDNKLAESLFDWSSTPFTTSVGEPWTLYFTLSSLLVLNGGKEPFQVDLSL